MRIVALLFCLAIQVPVFAIESRETEEDLVALAKSGDLPSVLRLAKQWARADKTKAAIELLDDFSNRDSQDVLFLKGRLLLEQSSTSEETDRGREILLKLARGQGNVAAAMLLAERAIDAGDPAARGFLTIASNKGHLRAREFYSFLSTTFCSKRLQAWETASLETEPSKRPLFRPEFMGLKIVKCLPSNDRTAWDLAQSVTDPSDYYADVIKGLMHHYNLVGDKSQQATAERYFEQALKKGHADAAFLIAIWLDDPAKQNVWLESASALNDVRAIKALTRRAEIGAKPVDPPVVVGVDDATAKEVGASPGADNPRPPKEEYSATNGAVSRGSNPTSQDAVILAIFIGGAVTAAVLISHFLQKTKRL